MLLEKLGSEEILQALQAQNLVRPSGLIETGQERLAVRVSGAFEMAHGGTLVLKEVADLPRRFAKVAQIAREAGFTGVQVHAAHGYLLSQFLTPLVNRREDRWGGDIAARASLLLEVVRAFQTTDDTLEKEA